VYLSSLDNPEEGLCQHRSAGRPLPNLNVSPNHVPRSLKSSTKDNSTRDPSEQKRKSRSGPPRINSANTVSFDVREDQKISQHLPSAMGVLDEPTRTDPRSFVQNVFGTVAFKMLEWLTPRNLELMAKAVGEDTRVRDDSTESLSMPFKKAESASPSHHKDRPVEKKANKSDAANLDASQPLNKQKPEPQEGLAETESSSASNEEVEVSESANVPTAAGAEPPRSRSNQHRVSDVGNHRPSKGILNISHVKGSDTMAEMGSFSIKPRRRLSQRNMVTVPNIDLPDKVLYMDGTHPSAEVKAVEKSEKRQVDESISKVFEQQHGPELISGYAKDTSRDSGDFTLPHSLSMLPIEVIDLICDILQEDNTYEKHYMHPHAIDKGLKRFRPDGIVLRRISTSQEASPYLSTSKRDWHRFIEQSIFDVLSRPEPLLQSFSNDKHMLYDSQTLWYLMIRMTRVASSLVFDSLWNVAGSLFHPPDKLAGLHEWPRDSESPISLSNAAAARVIIVCLHALVAALPLVTDARQLANMSRLRSYGLTMLGKGQSQAAEQAELCLMYDDAFTNDLTVRLARRIFAAIPARRHYALLEAQNETTGEERETDILEIILSSLDSAAPSILDFPDHERDLHEKRIPTLILDWARTILIQSWNGTAEVPSDGPFGGALAMVASICRFMWSASVSFN
jgi:hypothetical protein